MNKKKIVSVIATLLLSSFPAIAAQDINGHYEGYITVMGQNLKILVDINSENGKVNAKMDIPQQGAKNLPLNNIEYKDPEIHLELPSPNGIAILNGKVDKDKISGDFQQNSFSGTFNIEKTTLTNAETKPEKLPYRTENVNLKNGDVGLAGTLSLPEKKGNYPAVVMITGSGPQTRDEEVFDFPIFKVIADHLTKKGIAVLRLDDRGVGESKGGNIANATSEDYAGDINTAVNFLTNHSEINKNKIGLFGHSEGGLIAPMVAQINKNVAFMVLMSGPSESGDKIISEQSQLIAKANGATDDEIKHMNNLNQKAFSAIKTGKGWEELQKDVRKDISDSYDKLPDAQKKLIKDKNSYIENTMKQLTASYESKWFRYFITYDPQTILKKTTVPVLALFGGKDLQVPAASNVPLMESALKQAGNKNYQIKVFPDANHLYQSAQSGSPSEYATLDKSFVPGFLDTVSDWIINITK